MDDKKRFVDYTCPKGGDGRVRLDYILAAVRLPAFGKYKECYQIRHERGKGPKDPGVIYIDQMSYRRIKQILEEVSDG